MRINARIRIILPICLIAAVCVGAFFARAYYSGGSVACITQDGVVLRRIDLDTVETPYSFTITDGAWENTVEVKPGAIRVSDANCPDQICVSNDWRGKGASPIVCLPHRLVISFEHDPDAAIDVVSGA
ncbi:MAG: NusG domain II-containing protein [Oscillospiraceae bacterium]|nr:NusG domain II-containing protein [Oscillospiraceae bacterium]